MYPPDSDLPVTRNQARILVVDDEPTLRMGFRLALSTDGFAVEVAKDGEEALVRLESAAVDLMVLDLRMPGIDGIGVLEALASGRRHPPTVIASAHMDERIVVRAIQLGAVDFLGKPIHPNGLRSMVRLMLTEESAFAARGGAAPKPEARVAHARCLLRRRRPAEALAVLQAAPEGPPECALWRRIAMAATSSAETGSGGAPSLSVREITSWNPFLDDR